MKKRKIGIILILMGVGIPLVLFFFQDDGYFDLGNSTHKKVQRELTSQEIDEIRSILRGDVQDNFPPKPSKDYVLTYIELLGFTDATLKSQTWTITTGSHKYIPYKYTIGIGLILVFFGLGIFIFSFFPKEDKAQGDEPEKKGDE